MQWYWSLCRLCDVKEVFLEAFPQDWSLPQFARHMQILKHSRITLKCRRSSHAPCTHETLAVDAVFHNPHLFSWKPTTSTAHMDSSSLQEAVTWMRSPGQYTYWGDGRDKQQQRGRARKANPARSRPNWYSYLQRRHSNLTLFRSVLNLFWSAVAGISSRASKQL